MFTTLWRPKKSTKPLKEQLAAHIATPGDTKAMRRVAESVLPVEQPQLPWPITILESIDSELAAAHPIIDLVAIMRMRQRQEIAGLRGGIHPPRFALYDANGPGICGITPHTARVDSFFGGFAFSHAFPDWWPEEIAEFYRGELGGQPITLTAVFSGIIPSEIRQTIKAASSKFERVLLLQEVDKWDAQVHPVVDPLVIGVKSGVYYLVAAFDTTTIEAYVAREFTTDEFEKLTP